MGIPQQTPAQPQALPERLPIFTHHSVLLLPGCSLPLSIFEPRYVQLVHDALAGTRLIGVIQPLEVDAERHDPRVQQVGCAGRITSFRECDDGRYAISLIGVARFEVVRELRSDRLYRLVEPGWKRFDADRQSQTPPAIDREELVANLRAYFDMRGLTANWRAIEDSGNEELVNSLAMVCPFEASEKQALLESPNSAQRSRLVIALMNMAVLHRNESVTVH